jgi:putative transposase
VVLAQVQVNGAFDEPTQAPKLLACLDLRGIVVSGDALFAHRDLSLQIVQAHGDYLWLVKANQGGLYDEIQTLFEPVVTRPGWSAPPMDFRTAQTVEKGHGRLEKRRITVSSLLADYSQWPQAAQVFKLESQRTDPLGRTQQEVRYGITSLPAELKLHTDSTQFQALRRTQLAYRDGLNYVSRYAFEHGKLSNKVRLQEETYDELRARCHIPAQMACSIPRQVGATYKTLWTKVKQNNAARKAGHTKKRYKGLDKPPKYVSPTLTYQLGHDYGFKTEQRVSILTLDGRVIVPYTGLASHVALIHQGAHIGAAKLWYDKPKKQFYLLVSLEIEVADPTPESHTTVAGVDVGIRYLAVTATTRGDQSFHSGKRIVPKANHYARLRKRLQHKGTRSATRRLVIISGRERRLKQDANHVVSKRITERHPHALIGLEELQDIRERSKRKHGKKASKQQRRANATHSKWAFAELQSMIAYKALVPGSMAMKVDAYCTSRSCPLCGHTSEDNRPKKGLVFSCQHCRYTLHADLVGARNVTMRTLLARQDWVRTGHLSIAPDVSDDEAKAAQRQRYAELRWSLDTSPQALAGGH